MRIVVNTADATTLVTTYLTKLKDLAQLTECQGVMIGGKPVNPLPTKKLDELSDAQMLSLVQGIVEGKVQRFDLNGDGLFLFTSALSYNGRTDLDVTIKGRLRDIHYGLFISFAKEHLLYLAGQLEAA